MGIKKKQSTEDKARTRVRGESVYTQYYNARGGGGGGGGCGGGGGIEGGGLYSL